MIEMHSTTTGWRLWTGRVLLACVVAASTALASPVSAQNDTDADQGQSLVAPEVNTATGEEGTDRLGSATYRASAQTDVPQAGADSEAPDTKAGSVPAGVEREPKDTPTYSLWVVLLPALIAIVLAIVTRQVVPALIVGVLVGGYLLVPCLAADDPYAKFPSVIAGFRLAAERFVLGALTNPDTGSDRITIILFTLVIGFTVGVIGRNGGTEGMVRLIAGDTTSPRRGALTAWLAGMVVFFDDYANTMVVGPAMRSVFDRLKLSRAKLAYIVDSTAAPVASIALIGTWVGAEIGFIQAGLDTVTKSGAPAFLMDDNGNMLRGMQVFLHSLPYRFYPILALVLVFLIALTGRDFGPMKRAERKVLSKIKPDDALAQPGAEHTQQPRARWWLGFLPVGTLVVVTLGVLVATGLNAESTAEVITRVDADGFNIWAQTPWWEKASIIVSNSDSYLSIFHGAIFSAITAVLLTLVMRACSMRDTFDAGIEGMTRMFPAMIILVLAWALSGVLQDLKLGDVVAAQLKEQMFPVQWLPLAVFVCAAIVSFATGTSWGTMGILCPMVVGIAARLAADVEPAEAITLFYAAVGSVLAGAIFGDHCSPISDTTVLSSIASGCRHEEHVWTQLPYALTAAVAAMVLGDVMCSVYGQPWYLGLGAGVLLLVCVVYVVGRRAVASFELADV